MADASIIDIGGVQWNVKDKEARERIADIEEKRKLIENETFTGTFSFSARLKYIGENDTHIFYGFWWPMTVQVASTALTKIEVYPPDRSTDIIEHLSLGVGQKSNANIVVAKNDPIQPGMAFYLLNYTTEKTWSISGMGVMSRRK